MNYHWRLYRNEKITKEELPYQRLKQTFDDLRIEVSDAIINQMQDYIKYLSGYDTFFQTQKLVLSIYF